MTESWSIDSWREKPLTQAVSYEDPNALKAAVARLRELPPLVTSYEVEELKSQICDAQAGRRFLLMGGDCAERLADCRDDIITSKLKILLQMSLLLVQATHRPVTRVGRFAGQYAKPRSRPLEERQSADGSTQQLPSYFGDLINSVDFTEEARRPDPQLLVEGYKHAAMTLNFIRSLARSGFADLQHPENWDLNYVKNATLSEELRGAYLQACEQVTGALKFMQVLGDLSDDDLTKVQFFTSHEGLNLEYESAQTRRVPRREGWYCLTTHLPWIGERTRDLDGAHIEFFRGIENPVGVKLGPTATGDQLLRLLDALNPQNQSGKIVLITRFGTGRIDSALPPLIDAVRREGRQVLWMSDPMHGNTETTKSGVKTRNFDRILEEVRDVIAIHSAEGTWLGGVHFELTGEDVTECTGGAVGLTEDDLGLNYASACDPRLNYRQALEMAMAIGQQLGRP